MIDDNVEKKDDAKKAKADVGKKTGQAKRIRERRKLHIRNKMGDIQK
ncbi:MAG: hypothetical protein ABR985_17910 [Methanotrichaceae archaeon]|jgi:hypothetical protein